MCNVFNEHQNVVKDFGCVRAVVCSLKKYCAINFNIMTSFRLSSVAELYEMSVYFVVFDIIIPTFSKPDYK